MECSKRGPVMAIYQSSPFNTGSNWTQNTITFDNEVRRLQSSGSVQRWLREAPTAQSENATTATTESQEYVSSSDDTDGSSLPKSIIVDKVMSFFVQWLDRKLGVTSPPKPSFTRSKTAPLPAVGSSTSTDSPFVAAASPDEKWSKISDLAERRRISNRIAQRSYRKKLRRRLEILDRLAEGSGGTSSGSKALPGGSSSSSSRASTGQNNSTQRLKRAGGGDQSDQDSGSGEGDDKRRGKRPRIGTLNDSNERVKLACPYYKHNARKYKQQRPCCGPGWDFVHRIKEHLYRKHALPRYTCPRCCERFEAEDELSTHARAPEPCEVREPELHDGFTQAQEKRLRSRKKDRAGGGAEDLTEEQKWRQMYQILFPDVRAEEIPSPYYEDNDLNKGELEGFEDYLRRELPPLVRRQLEQEVERELNFVEEGLKSRVINMVHGLQLTLFQSYRKMEESEASQPEAFGASLAAPAGSAPSLNSEPSAPPNGGFSPQADPPAQVTSPAPQPEELGHSGDSFDEFWAWHGIQSDPCVAADGFDFPSSNVPLADSNSMLASDSGYTSGGGDADKSDYLVQGDPSHFEYWVTPD
ncbi:hypothetical protein MAPG_10002 [Magnaporthiopsis poae ATCC 64411]|uniref:C2H2-type domain-containing protein n=1 Tax=Magnaporthiopsis poae (strain ATCC 64411 / 73-15) TaxID=644358 RepID=A0A0C4EBF5_MAGP6|nr:hypothetical protein MAPG_10002 [Magnaporthiopsis poae ATCC 64411]